MAGDKCDSVNVHQERGPFTLQGMCKKRGPYKKERLSHILATNVFGLTNSVTKFMVVSQELGKLHSYFYIFDWKKLRK